MERFGITFLVLWLIVLTLVLAFWAGVVYVAMHFIMKVW